MNVLRVEHQGKIVAWRRFDSAAVAAAPPLVLLHGGHGNWQHWARNIEALAARFTVWVPDMPGYGDSDTPPEPMLASLIGQLQATLDQLLGAATPIRLAGFSCGGCPPRTRCAGRPACLWPQSAPASWRATSP